MQGNQAFQFYSPTGNACISPIRSSLHRHIDQTPPTRSQDTGSKGAARAVGGRQDANRRDGRYGHSRGNHNGTRIDKTIAQELEAIHGQYLKDTEFLKSYYGGSHLIADTLEVVMARLAATADLDTARLNIAQMFRLVVEEIAVAGSDFPRRLREFSELLRQCMDSLDDDDDDED
jgi:hypothetical protein